MGNIFDRGHAPLIAALVNDGEELGITAFKLDATTTPRNDTTAMRHRLFVENLRTWKVIVGQGSQGMLICLLGEAIRQTWYGELGISLYDERCWDQGSCTPSLTGV